MAGIVADPNIAYRPGDLLYRDDFTVVEYIVDEGSDRFRFGAGSDGGEDIRVGMPRVIAKTDHYLTIVVALDSKREAVVWAEMLFWLDHLEAR